MSQQVSSLRVYIENIIYNSLYWLDNPTQLKDDFVDNVLPAISNFTYGELVIHNVRNASNKTIEVHINNCKRNGTAELTSTQVDQLCSDLNTELNDSGNFTYDFSFSGLQVISDRFLDDPSSGYPEFNLSQQDLESETAVYIRGVTLNASAWNSDVENNVFAPVDLALRDISGLEYGDLNIYQSHNYTYLEQVSESMMIFFKKSLYNSVGYISDSDSATLRTSIINQLNSIDNLTYDDVELRVSRRY